MKILLINNNPVVSRLTALSARKENVSLDEIKNISELKASNYNIIFVDGESFNNDVSNIIRNSGVEKRVLFYSQGEEDNQSMFTQTILKPFLPSEVSEILRDSKLSLLKEKEESKKEEIKKPVVFDDLVEENREKELETLNVLDEKETSKDDSTTKLAVATAKSTVTEQKDKFDKKLEEAFPLNLDTLSESEESDKKEEKNHEKDMFELDDDLFSLEDKKDTAKESLDSVTSVDSDLFEIDKKIKDDILDDNVPLEFDLESKEEVNFEPKPEVSKEDMELEKELKPDNTTKVLDNSEISNIKDILDEKDGAETLTQIPTSLMSINEKDEKDEKNIIETEAVEDSVEEESLTESREESSVQSEKNKKKKKKNSDKLTTGDAIAQTLKKLPVEDLRKLLRGAKIDISIQFPNEL